jgi:hypothetical protein
MLSARLPSPSFPFRHAFQGSRISWSLAQYMKTVTVGVCIFSLVIPACTEKPVVSPTHEIRDPRACWELDHNHIEVALGPPASTNVASVTGNYLNTQIDEHHAKPLLVASGGFFAARYVGSGRLTAKVAAQHPTSHAPRRVIATRKVVPRR